MATKRTLLQSFTTPFGEIPSAAALVAACIVWALVLGVWAIASYGGYVADMFLPVPDAVIRRGISLASDGTLFVHIWSSVKVVILGFLLSAVIAVPLGIAMGAHKGIEAFLEPFVSFCRYLPASAFIPLLILWAGIGEMQKVLVIFIGSVFQILLMVAVSVGSARKDLVEAAYTLGAQPSGIVKRVLIPGAAPEIAEILRLVLGWAWTYVIVAELIGSSSGIGHMITDSQSLLNTGQIIFGIIVIGLIGLISDFAFKALNRRLFAWSSL